MEKLLITLELNIVSRYLVSKYFQMKPMKYFYNRENFV